MDSCLIFTTNSFFISKKNFKIIIENAKAFDKVETGGLMFGTFDKYGNPIVFNVINPISNCKRTSTSFIIHKEYAISITKEKEDKGLYNLANWHSHKGYGGPSHGDDVECKKFLEINKHKKRLYPLL